MPKLIDKDALLERARQLDTYAWSDFAAIVEEQPVIDPLAELEKNYPRYSVLPRDCIERTLKRTAQ